MTDSSNDLRRICEIRDCALKLDSQKAYFKQGDDKLTNPSKRRYFVELEQDLQGLDIEAWKHLKSEICCRLKQKSELRGWQQLFDIFNEARGYNYLVSIGCAEVSFIPRASTKTPDLRAMHGNTKVLCDVKTINISDYEAKRRANGEVGSTRMPLPEGFFKKLLGDLQTAADQMQTFDASDGVRRLAYVVINFDDSLNEYADDWRNQIEAYLENSAPRGLEVVLDIKSAFSDIRIKAIAPR